MKRWFVVVFGFLLLLGIVFLLSCVWNGKKTTSNDSGARNGPSPAGPTTPGIQAASPVTAAMPLAANGSADVISTSAVPAIGLSPRKRAWDPQFLPQLDNPIEGISESAVANTPGTYLTGTAKHQLFGSLSPTDCT